MEKYYVYHHELVAFSCFFRVTFIVLSLLQLTRIFFFIVDPGKVTAEYYNNLTLFDVQTLLDRPDFKQQMPTETGGPDNMVSVSNLDDNSSYKLAAYFVTPITGNYTFAVSCDNKCNVYFNHGPNVNRTNHKIIKLASHTTRFTFNE